MLLVVILLVLLQVVLVTRILLPGSMYPVQSISDFLIYSVARLRLYYKKKIIYFCPSRVMSSYL